MKLLSVLDHSARLRRRTASDLDLDELANRIERFDLASVEPSTLASVARRARLAGVHPEVAALLTDTEAPAVVRSRAFGLVHRRLAAATPADTDPIRAAAA